MVTPQLQLLLGNTAAAAAAWPAEVPELEQKWPIAKLAPWQQAVKQWEWDGSIDVIVLVTKFTWIWVFLSQICSLDVFSLFKQEKPIALEFCFAARKIGKRRYTDCRKGWKRRFHCRLKQCYQKEDCSNHLPYKNVFSFWNWILSGDFFSFGCSSDSWEPFDPVPPWITVGSCRGGAGDHMLLSRNGNKRNNLNKNFWKAFRNFFPVVNWKVTSLRLLRKKERERENMTKGKERGKQNNRPLLPVDLHKGLKTDYLEPWSD